MINSFLLAFAMYSKIPMPRAFSVKPWRHRI